MSVAPFGSAGAWVCCWQAIAKGVAMKCKCLKSFLAKHSGVVKAVLVVLCLALGVIVSVKIMKLAWGCPFETRLLRYCPAIPGNIVIWAFLALVFCAAYAQVVIFREGEESYDLCGKIVSNEQPSRAGASDCDELSPSAEQGDPNGELAAFFMTACLTPREVFSRIDERVKTYTRSLRVESRFTIRVPNRLRGLTPVVPIVFHPRGDYPESLELESANPGVDYLNIQETQAYVGKVLEAFLPEVFLSSNHQEVREKAANFLGFVDALDSETVKTRRAQYCELMEEVLGVVGDDENAKRRFTMVKAFMSMMIDSFPVCVMLPLQPSGDDACEGLSSQGELAAFTKAYSTVELTLTRRMPLVAVEALGPKYGKPERLVARLVKRPNTFFYGLGNADRAQSYHLQTVGPERTFCSLAKLKKRGVAADGGETSSSADLALAQNRLGQRHFWFCVQNGSGFCHWWLMFRHSPRRMDAYHLSLVVMAIEAIALWSYAYAEFFASGLSSSSAAISFVSILLGVMSIVAVWVSRSNNFGRGGDLGAQVAAIIATLVAVVAVWGMNVPHEAADNTWPLIVVALIAILLSCCLLLFARACSWMWVAYSFRKCDKSSVNLISGDSVAMAGDDDSANISPGWLAVDANRFIAERDDRAIREELESLYRVDREYVRNAMLSRRCARVKKAGKCTWNVQEAFRKPCTFFRNHTEKRR